MVAASAGAEALEGYALMTIVTRRRSKNFVSMMLVFSYLDRHVC